MRHSWMCAVWTEQITHACIISWCIIFIIQNEIGQAHAEQENWSDKRRCIRQALVCIHSCPVRKMSLHIWCIMHHSAVSHWSLVMRLADTGKLSRILNTIHWRSLLCSQCDRFYKLQTPHIVAYIYIYIYIILHRWAYSWASRQWSRFGVNGALERTFMNSELWIWYGYLLWLVVRL